MLEISNYDVFNSRKKYGFINSLDFTDNTKKTMLSDLAKAKIIEERLNKDISEFNIDEVAELIKSLNSATVVTLRSNISTYKTYVDYCYRMDDIVALNNFEKFQSTYKLSDYISSEKVDNKYLTEEEVMEVLESLVNPVDKMAIALPYNFVTGSKLEELRAVKIKDLNLESNTLIIRNEKDEEIRRQRVPNYVKDILVEASEVDYYLFNNGMGTKNQTTQQDLANTEYLMRPLKRKSNEGAKSTFGYVQSKYVKIKSYLGEEYEYVTPISLRTSRVFNMIDKEMKKFEEEEPSLKTFQNVFKKIYLDFGIELTKMQMYGYRLSFRKYNEMRIEELNNMCEESKVSV